MNKNIVLHPLLFALYPVLFQYSYNLGILYPHEIVYPLLATFLCTCIAWCLLNLFIKNKTKSGAIVSIFLLMFFSYKHYLLIMIGIIHKGFFTRDLFLFPLWLIILSLILYLILKEKNDLKFLTTLLNVMAMILIVFNGINIINYEVFKRYPFNKRLTLIKLFHTKTNCISSPQINQFPDIYYIIFDRYANSHVLKEYLNYDNSDFTDYLTKKGFFIADKSRANYPRTFSSLGSSLNLNYLDFVAKSIGKNSNDQTVIYDLLEDYRAWHFLKSKGYKLIHFGGRWGPTKSNKYAYFNSNFLILDEFSAKLLKNTPLIRIINEYMENAHAKLSLHQFDKLSEVPKIEGPKFVFAHFLIPHEPYIFGQNGEQVKKLKQYRKKSTQEKYIDQLIFTNKKIKMLVDSLISNSKTLPVIIIQSDEGPYVHNDFKGKAGPKVSNWETISNDALRVHMRIFNAYYFPGVDTSKIYNSITPVNTFRLLFNLYFDTKYKLLNDESFIINDANYPYEFINVTDKVKFQ